MEKLTYKQAYDKIIQAYFKDEIKPYRANFCFCGTLAGGRTDWGMKLDEQKLYSKEEYEDMERALLIPLGTRYIRFHQCDGGVEEGDIGYEEKLFIGMSAALEVLKEIHRARGEDVDEVPTFTKRELLTPLSGIKN